MPRATTPAVERPSSWSELIAATCGESQGTDFIGGQGLMWSEFRPARAPVVMERRSAVSSLLTWAVVNAAAWVGVQRRELGGTEGIEAAGGQVVDLPGRQRLTWAVVRRAIWSVVRALRVGRVRPLACGTLVSEAILAAGQRLEPVDLRLLSWSLSRGRAAVVVSDLMSLVLDGAQLVVAERGELVGLEHTHLAAGQRDDAGRGQAVELIELMPPIWAVVSAPTSSVDRALMWSGVEARQGAVVMARRSAPSLLSWAVVRGRRPGRIVSAANWAVPSALRLAVGESC